jgi:positive regulator of sigma E activity
MSETGVIVGLYGDQAMVEMEASRECEACGACRYTSTGRMVTSVQNSLDAQVGDTVKIDIEPQLVVAAALIVFTGYAVFFWLGELLGLNSEGVGIFGGIILLIASYFVVRTIDKRAGISHRFEPRMYDIIRGNSSGR